MIFFSLVFDYFIFNYSQLSILEKKKPNFELAKTFWEKIKQRLQYRMLKMMDNFNPNH